VLADPSGPLKTVRSSSVHGPVSSGALCGAEAGVVVTVTVTGAAGAGGLACGGAANEVEGVAAVTVTVEAGVAGAHALGRTAGEQNNRQQGQRDQLHVQLLQVVLPGWAWHRKDPGNRLANSLRSWSAGSNCEVFFASEIKALLALGVPAAWDLEGAIGGMGRSHEKTEFAGISTVPPGCYAIAKEGDVRIYPCWDWEIPTAEQVRADTRSDAEIVDEFREALRDALRQRLVADVEVASYLSGGIDSCAVLGLAQQEMDRPIRAFTLTFDNPLYDETSIAEAQAKHVGATYHPIPITGREIADSFADAIWHSETQMFNGHGVAKYLLSRAVRAAGIKVVFTGEGADEMLGCHPYFRIDALNDNAALSAGKKTALLDEMLGANPATRALLMPEQVDSPEMQAVERRLGWLPASLNMGAAQTNSVSAMFRDDLPATVREFQPLVSALDRLPLAQRVAGRDHLNQMLYVNAKTVLPNFILNYLADRMEMAHSIEGRVPFLDHHVAEVAARVPVNMKVKGIREKHVLREAAKDVLIPEVYDRQKHPFTTPPTRNENDPMLTFYRDTFASQAAKDQPIYDMKKVSTALDQLLECPVDQRIAVEGGLQRVASVVVMQELFSMA
jgi:asparagine synthase (glutamine-hydrolysing)